MNKKIYSVAIFIAISLPVFAQWEVGVGAGSALPITGNAEVFKAGSQLAIEGKYHFGNGHFVAGIQTQWVGFQRDKNPSDLFENLHLTMVPIIFFAEYEFLNGKFRPFVSGGIGLTPFMVSYNETFLWTDADTIIITTKFEKSNISFTISPQAGFRYSINQHLRFFAEGNFVFIPPSFSSGPYQLTGYASITGGLSYQFGKYQNKID